jgi:rhodanese-related sulfurtransferase
MPIDQLHPLHLRQLLKEQPQALIIDVRELPELAWRLPPDLPQRHIPLRQLPAELEELPAEVPLILLCHHGVRSMAAARYLEERGFDQLHNLMGGIDLYAREVDPGVGRY